MNITVSLKSETLIPMCEMVSGQYGIIRKSVIKNYTDRVIFHDGDKVITLGQPGHHWRDWKTQKNHFVYILQKSEILTSYFACCIPLTDEEKEEAKEWLHENAPDIVLRYCDFLMERT